MEWGIRKIRTCYVDFMLYCGDDVFFDFFSRTFIYLVQFIISVINLEDLV